MAQSNNQCNEDAKFNRNCILNQVFCHKPDRNKDWDIYLMIGFLIFAISLYSAFYPLNKKAEERNLTIVGKTDSPLRDNLYAYLIFAFCTCAFSISNWRLPPKFVVNGICFLNLIHGFFAPFFKENDQYIFFFLQFSYAISTSTCWVIVSKLVNSKRDSDKDSLSSVCCFFFFQAMSMIDVPFFCFSINDKSFSLTYFIRILLTSVRAIAIFYSNWHSKEKYVPSQNTPEVGVENGTNSLIEFFQNWWKDLWKTDNKSLFGWFRLFHSVTFTSYWSCLFPFRFASIGNSTYDNFMGYAACATATGIILGIAIIMLFVQKDMISPLTMIIVSTIIMILSYLIALIYFNDVSLEGLASGGDDKFWLAMFCKCFNCIGTSTNYSIIMAFTTTMSKTQSKFEVRRMLANIGANLFFYILLFKYQLHPYNSPLLKFLALVLPTIGLSYYYWKVAQDKQVEQNKQVEQIEQIEQVEQIEN